MYNSIVQQDQYLFSLDETPSKLFPEVYNKIVAAIHEEDDVATDDQNSQEDTDDFC